MLDYLNHKKFAKIVLSTCEDFKKHSQQEFVLRQFHYFNSTVLKALNFTNMQFEKDHSSFNTYILMKLALSENMRSG